MVNLVNLRALLTILFKEEFKINTKRVFEYERIFEERIQKGEYHLPSSYLFKIQGCSTSIIF